MSNTDFFRNENIEMLWDIIIDEEIFKNKSSHIQNEVKTTFLNNIEGFYKTEKLNTKNLIDLNKKYILMILNYIKNSFSQQKQNFIPQNNKIKIYDEPLDNKKALITFEDIQNDRTTQFERDLNKHKEDFNDSMSLAIPPVPNFADDSKDLPINEMEKMIKEMTDKRNYDIEQINRNINVSNADNWLKPKETSIKSEKYQPPQQKQFENNNSGLKHIKIENTELDTNLYKNQIIDLNILPSHDASKKNVTWGENITLEVTERNYDNFIDDTDLFKKLKKIEKVETIPNKEININTSGDVLLLKEQVIELNKKVEFLNNLHNKIEVLDNNINIILDLLKNKNEI
jgi:hypothetical protein